MIDNITDAPQGQKILSLLDFLATAAPVDPVRWQQWQIMCLTEGANNLLYRATSEQGEFAIKFTLRDARDRAGREYQALAALQCAGLDLAPQPVLLERQRYPQPVVVTTWLTGTSTATPPTNDAEWDALIRHFAAIHTLSPATSAVSLPPVVLTMSTAEEGLARIRDQLLRLPAESQPPALRGLIDRAARAPFPSWPEPPLVLCRGDPNSTNFLRRPGAWASVDWEYSGWGDPAFEIADLVTHPKYATVAPARWDWAVEHYCAIQADPAAERRIRVYAQLMLVWWAARFARLLYEAPRGLDERLVTRPADWASTARRQYQRYLASGHAALDKDEQSH